MVLLLYKEVKKVLKTEHYHCKNLALISNVTFCKKRVFANLKMPPKVIIREESHRKTRIENAPFLKSAFINYADQKCPKIVFVPRAN